MKDLVLLIVGVPFGVLANYAYQYMTTRVDIFLDPIKLKGKWGQRVSVPGERRCSAGEIRYDRRRRMWTFDGINYNNDGTQSGHWTTEASHLDKTAHKFYYIFTSTLVEAAHAGYMGFGIVEFRRSERTWIPDRGFFISDNENEKYRSHSMVRLDEIPTEQDAILEIFKSKLKLT